VNRIRSHQVKKGEMLSVEDIEDVLRIKKVGVIPDEEKMVDYTNKGEPIVLSNNSSAGTALMNIARRLMGEDIPFNELTEKKGFFSRLIGG
jgi:septum site-determining protein MinD